MKADKGNRIKCGVMNVAAWYKRIVVMEYLCLACAGYLCERVVVEHHVKVC